MKFTPIRFFCLLASLACFTGGGAATAVTTPASPAVCGAAPAANSAALVEPQRGVWIATPEHTRFFDSPAEMDRQLLAWREIGINTVYAAMWNQGRTMFPSETMKRLTGVAIDEKLAGRDPLQDLVVAAKRHGIKVYAWFEFGFASDFKGGPGSEITRLRPAWRALDSSGKQVEKNGFRWMNALDPEVQDFMLGLIMEAVQRYDIDGIQGDDRLPALPSTAGYNPGTVAQYQSEHGGKASPQDSAEPAWLAWRAGKLNDFMQRLHGEIKAAKPRLQISMSPSPFPWGYDEYLQDWPTWLRQGWVDSISPQLYRYNIDGYRTELHKITREQVCPQQLDRVFPGLLLALGRDYLASPDLLRQMIEANRQEGVMGEVFFHSEGLIKRSSTLAPLYRPASVKPAGSDSARPSNATKVTDAAPAEVSTQGVVK